MEIKFDPKILSDERVREAAIRLFKLTYGMKCDIEVSGLFTGFMCACGVSCDDMCAIEYELNNPTIDLRTCKIGDKLRIRMTGSFKEASVRLQGENVSDIVTYMGTTDETNYYDHKVEYSNGAVGSRTDDGSTFRHNKKVDDPDVIEIIGS